MAAHFERNVLTPARRAQLDVAVFGHSWNPEVGPLLDTLFRVDASRHEPPLSREVLRAHCGRFRHANSSRFGRAHQIDCERVRSQLLGIQRALHIFIRQ